MRKVGVCAIAAALLIATGSVSEAQAAMLPVNTMNLNCGTVEELKDKLQQISGCENIWELLSKWNCGNLPEVEVPEQPEAPEDNVPEQPGTEVHFCSVPVAKPDLAAHCVHRSSHEALFCSHEALS